MVSEAKIVEQLKVWTTTKTTDTRSWPPCERYGPAICTINDVWRGCVYLFDNTTVNRFIFASNLFFFYIHKKECFTIFDRCENVYLDISFLHIGQFVRLQNK